MLFYGRAHIAALARHKEATDHSPRRLGQAEPRIEEIELLRSVIKEHLLIYRDLQGRSNPLYCATMNFWDAAPTVRIQHKTQAMMLYQQNWLWLYLCLKSLGTPLPIDDASQMRHIFTQIFANAIMQPLCHVFAQRGSKSCLVGPFEATKCLIWDSWLLRICLKCDTTNREVVWRRYQGDLGSVLDAQLHCRLKGIA